MLELFCETNLSFEIFSDYLQGVQDGDGVFMILAEIFRINCQGPVQDRYDLAVLLLCAIITNENRLSTMDI